ncbi:MAG TPA: hypothetical protein VKC53_01095 [Patescibacteria group bacterium]|nr:hypothetical protein [Patescibacteria group bacterium]
MLKKLFQGELIVPVDDRTKIVEPPVLGEQEKWRNPAYLASRIAVAKIHEVRARAWFKKMANDTTPIENGLPPDPMISVSRGKEGSVG